MGISRSRRTWVRLFLAIVLATPSLAQPSLQVEEAFLSDVEGGEKIDPLRGFSMGETVYLDFKIGGFGKTGDPPRANLDYEIRAVDDRGTSLAPVQSGTVDVEITPEDKHWRPRIRYSVEIPPVPRAGEHKFLIQVKDKVANSEARAEIPIRVYSNLPDPPAALSVYDMKLYRSENEDKPVIEDQSFRPGDKLYARFYLTGYQFAAKNGYRLEYGIYLRNSAGKTLLSVPKAAQETRESFYPKTYVACAFSVDLEKTIRSGIYTLTVIAKDLVANNHVESTFNFNVQ